MDCLCPTIINVYDIGESFKIVRRLFNIDHDDIASYLLNPGDDAIVLLTDAEQDKLEALGEERVKRAQAKVVSSQIIPCGSCSSCIKSRQRHWIQRIIADHQTCGGMMLFYTFTYSEDMLPRDHQLSKDVAKKLVAGLKHLYPGCRYFLAGEYGSKNGRPHYHCLIWNISHLNGHIIRPASLGKDFITYYCECDAWPYGAVTVSEANDSCVAYCCQYCTKKLSRSKEEKEKFKAAGFQPEFQFMTRGIAYNYYAAHLDDYDKDHRSHLLRGGTRFVLDRSFLKYKEKVSGEKDKEIFSDIESTFSGGYSITTSNRVSEDHLKKGGSRNL